MGGRTILVSMERGVASPTEDPEQAVLLQVVWCLIITFETIGVGDVCTFARGKR